MNSERRHELQQNDLADFLGKYLKMIEPYTKLIAVAVALAAVAFLIVGFTRSAAVGKRSDATLELLQNASSGDAEALALVGQRHVNTEAGLWARLYQADALLMTGINSLFSDRGEAESNLAEAVKQYQDVAAATKQTLLLSRASLGAGKGLESQGKLEDAIRAYEQVIKIAESPQVVTLAEQRIAQLKNPATEQFLAWFKQHDFAPPMPSPPPGMPSDLSLPDIPDLTLPEVSPLAIPAELQGTISDGPAPGQMTLPAEAPAAESAPAVEEAPATEVAPAAEDAVDPAPATPAAS